MPVPSTTKNMTTLISSHLFRSLWVSSSSLFSLWCRRLCRAVGVTLGGGGQGVSWRSSGLRLPTGFTLKRCCSTTERIVLSRKLRGRNQRKVGRHSKLIQHFLLAIAKTRHYHKSSDKRSKINLLCHIWSAVDRGQKVTEGKTRGQEVSDCDRKQVVTTGHWAMLRKSLELYFLLC